MCREGQRAESLTAMAQWRRQSSWKTKEWSGSVEDTISRGLWASLPACVNQHAAHGCNEVENKKNIKMSEWNRRQGGFFFFFFMMSLNSLFSAVDPVTSLDYFSEAVHHLSVCILTKMILTCLMHRPNIIILNQDMDMGLLGKPCTLEQLSLKLKCDENTGMLISLSLKKIMCSLIFFSKTSLGQIQIVINLKKRKGHMLESWTKMLFFIRLF